MTVSKFVLLNVTLFSAWSAFGRDVQLPEVCRAELVAMKEAILPVESRGQLVSMDKHLNGLRDRIKEQVQEAEDKHSQIQSWAARTIEIKATLIEGLGSLSGTEVDDLQNELRTTIEKIDELVGEDGTIHLPRAENFSIENIDHQLENLLGDYVPSVSQVQRHMFEKDNFLNRLTQYRLRPLKALPKKMEEVTFVSDEAGFPEKTLEIEKLSFGFGVYGDYNIYLKLESNIRDFKEKTLNLDGEFHRYKTNESGSEVFYKQRMAPSTLVASFSVVRKGAAALWIKPNDFSLKDGSLFFKSFIRFSAYLNLLQMRYSEHDECLNDNGAAGLLFRFDWESDFFDGLDSIPSA